MEIIGPDQLTPFVPQTDTDAAYPARIGEPSVDGAVIYPEQQPDEPENVVPFQRETGLDPAQIPALRELGPKLRLLEGGKQNGAGSTAIVPAGRIANDTDPTTMVRFGAAPEAGAASGFPWKTLLVVGAAAAVGYFMGRTANNNGPLIAGLDEDEE
jgi:hypothetical protein